MVGSYQTTERSDVLTKAELIDRDDHKCSRMFLNVSFWLINGTSNYAFDFTASFTMSVARSTCFDMFPV